MTCCKQKEGARGARKREREREMLGHIVRWQWQPDRISQMRFAAPLCRCACWCMLLFNYARSSIKAKSFYIKRTLPREGGGEGVFMFNWLMSWCLSSYFHETIGSLKLHYDEQNRMAHVAWYMRPPTPPMHDNKENQAAQNAADRESTVTKGW